MSDLLPMRPAPKDEAVHLRRADTNERFVAFAFASAEMLVEADTSGTIVYASGAFRTKFGRAPETFVGAGLQTLIAPSDHEAIGSALCLLAQRGRLQPMMVRLSDAARTPLALAGLVLPAPGRPPRLCLTFARPPEKAAAVLRPGTAHSFARATESRMRAGTAGALCLVEVAAQGTSPMLDAAALSRALEEVAPDAQASELAPGRFGVLETGMRDAASPGLAAALERVLRVQGNRVTLTGNQFDLAAEGLTPAQAARALRHALNAFARDGAHGLSEAGLGSDLAGYMKQAGRKTDIMRRVIRDGRFTLSYQPIVALGTRKPHHYEALIRPKPIPDLRLEGPQEFVMLVEALGLADELDLRVASLACDQASRAGLSVGFNLSGQSVQSPAFRDRLIATLNKHPACQAGLAIVEVTETAEVEDVGEALLTAQALRSIGVPFCLDDFGAGTADMRLLRALAPNIVKLDGSYVPGIAAAGRERAFVAGMVEIASAMGAKVVAERVETEEEAAALAGLGVQYGQGWLFGRPAPLPQPKPVASARRQGEKESWG